MIGSLFITATDDTKRMILTSNFIALSFVSREEKLIEIVGESFL